MCHYSSQMEERFLPSTENVTENLCCRLVNTVSNRPHSIYQYSSIALRLSGQVFKFLLSLNSQERLRYKENNAKYRRLT